MRFRVIITQNAEMDLKAARNYIAQRAPQTAERWMLEFVESILRLANTAEMRPLAMESNQSHSNFVSYFFEPEVRTPIEFCSESLVMRCEY